jgi:hypothetical protein
LRGEFHTAIALAGRNELDRLDRRRAQFARVHLKIVAAKIAVSGRPQILHHPDIFGAVVVAFAKMIVAGPQPHLAVFDLVPTGDDVDAKPPARDVGDG